MIGLWVLFKCSQVFWPEPRFLQRFKKGRIHIVNFRCSQSEGGDNSKTKRSNFVKSTAYGKQFRHNKIRNILRQRLTQKEVRKYLQPLISWWRTFCRPKQVEVFLMIKIHQKVFSLFLCRVHLGSMLELVKTVLFFVRRALLLNAENQHDPV